MTEPVPASRLEEIRARLEAAKSGEGWSPPTMEQTRYLLNRVAELEREKDMLWRRVNEMTPKMTPCTCQTVMGGHVAWSMDCPLHPYGLIPPTVEDRRIV